jgi:hypothetical protein
VTNAIVLEELAHGDAALAIAAAAASPFGYAIADQGTDEQRDAFLPLLCGQRMHAASLAVNEPVPGFDVFAPRTTASRNGKGLVLTGSKCFVPLADRASHFLVVARQGGNWKRTSCRATPPAEHRRGGEEPRAQGADDRHADLRRCTSPSAIASAAPTAPHPAPAQSLPRRPGGVLNGVSRAVLDYCVPYAKGASHSAKPSQEAVDRVPPRRDAHEVESMRWMIWKRRATSSAAATPRAAPTSPAPMSTRRRCGSPTTACRCSAARLHPRHPVEMWYPHARTLSVLEGLVAV